jgi:F-type H+-transporting ATPase subunit beta
VAEAFTGKHGVYVKIEDTIKGFNKIVDGEMDEVPEQAFYMCGAIEEVYENYEAMKSVE